MKRGLKTAGALVLTLAVATAASADTAQLAASAGIDPAEAASYSLTEIAQAKINADIRRDDRNAVARRGSRRRSGRRMPSCSPPRASRRSRA